MSTTAERRKHWGWGSESRQPSVADLEAMAPLVRERLGFDAQPVEEPVPLEAIDLPESRITPPRALEPICAADPHSRATHAFGKATRDVGAAFAAASSTRLTSSPARATSARWRRCSSGASTQGYAAIPYGGGTSVVGGIEPRLPREYPGVVSIDLGALDRVLEVDEVSRSARIQAGAAGPVLEDQLRARGLTLRCFPQSFEFSTLGGWIATRAGGHFATKLTHIDDMVESVRAITPAGEWESRRLPGSGAGPSPDRMLIGSEGILGMITEAWVRVQPRPTHRASCAVAFESFAAGAGGRTRAVAVRARPVELPAARCHGGAHQRRRRRRERDADAGLRVRAPSGRLRTWTSRSKRLATTAARRARCGPAAAGTGARRPAHGATRSWRRRTCATR